MLDFLTLSARYHQSIVWSQGTKVSWKQAAGRAGGGDGYKFGDGVKTASRKLGRLVGLVKPAKETNQPTRAASKSKRGEVPCLVETVAQVALFFGQPAKQI